MKIGKVVGTVVSTQKDEKLIGCKLLVVQPINKDGESLNEEIVAVDIFGAGVGETVLLCFGSAARAVFDTKDIPVDVSVVGIIDTIENY